MVYKVSSFGVLQEISYQPTEADNKLRCKGFPSYNLIGSMYYPIYSFAQSDVTSAKGILDSFIIELMNTTANHKVYIVAYSGNNLSKKRYENLLIELKKHVFDKRKVSPESFQIIDGGKSNSFYMDIFIIEKNYPPPVPSPKN